MKTTEKKVKTMNIYKKIYKEIKKAKVIVLAHHIGPDPDALGSSLALKEIILNKFPNKEVYAVGHPTSRFSFLGKLDKLPELKGKTLLIVTDTPDLHRIDSASPQNFPKSIKIDHHPFIEKTCDLEWIDPEASSACQMIVELVSKTKLELTPQAAACLFAGIVTDTNRFMFEYTTPKTFKLVSKMLEDTDIDINKIYNELYLRPYKEIKFENFLSSNFTITENGVAYIKVTDDDLKKYDVDVATPGNMINNFNFIKEILVWATCTEDKNNKIFRISVRSRGPVINHILERHHGGGHKFASGVRLQNSEEFDEIVKDLDAITKQYNEN